MSVCIHGVLEQKCSSCTPNIFYGAAWDRFIAFIQTKHACSEVKNVIGGEAQLRRDFVFANTHSAMGGDQTGWHAPGIGEVHNADHSLMVFCTKANPDPDGDPDYLPDDALAGRLAAVLNAAGAPPVDFDGEPITPQRLIEWLDVKFSRHGEEEDKWAADYIRATLGVTGTSTSQGEKP